MYGPSYRESGRERLRNMACGSFGNTPKLSRTVYGRNVVEISADRVDHTRAVTTRLPKRDPTKGKSIRERLRKIWHVGFREGRNVDGPSRSHTGRHDPSTKTRPDKLEVRWQVGF